MDTKRFSLVKPTIYTPFHIDFFWWKEHDSNWRVYLLGCLCPEHQKLLANQSSMDRIDWVDPYTAEIQLVDGLQHILITHCAKQAGFLADHTALVDSAFRIFLANGNIAMTPLELSKSLGKPAETILRTLAGPHVYKGVRPYNI